MAGGQGSEAEPVGEEGTRVEEAAFHLGNKGTSSERPDRLCQEKQDRFLTA